MTGSHNRHLATVFWASAANLMISLSALATGPLLARELEPAGRGAMAALLAPISLANLIFTCGLPETLVSHVAGGKLSARQALRVAVLGGLACGLVAALLTGALAPVILRGYPEYTLHYALLCMTLPVTIGFAAVRGVIMGQRGFGSINRERYLGTMLRVLLLFGLAATVGLDPVLAVWTTVLCGIVGSFALLPSAARADGPSRLDAGMWGSVRRYAASVAPGTLGSPLVARLDQSMMVPLAPPAQLGFYAVAVSLAELPLGIIAAVRDLVFSLSSESKDPRSVAKFCRLTLLLMVPICGAGIVAAPIAIPLLFGTDFRSAVLMAQILFFGTIMSVVAAIIGAGLMSMGSPLTRSILQIASAALAVVLILLLVPRWGGLGAAVAAVTTYTFLAATLLIAFCRQTKVGFRECLIPTRTDFTAMRLPGRGRPRR